MKLSHVFYFVFTLLFASTLLHAQADTENLFAETEEFLPVDEAFIFDFEQQIDKLVLHWKIADGYYLYQKQFKIISKQANLGDLVFPLAQQKEDEFFGITAVYHHQVSLEYPIISSPKDGAITIKYQGCAEAGLCYPPATKTIQLDQVTSNLAIMDKASTSLAATNPPVSQQFELANLLGSDDTLALTLLIFLVLGIGLAFTPCVFPMYPILSGIVIGQGKQISTKRAFLLSFVYVQGMALTYSLLGLVVAIAGVQFQSALQHPAILVTLIVVFALLALVMFGAYELQLPSQWQEKLNSLSNNQTSGSYFGVLLMGAISGLVASPCTTAPLTGILLYIAQSGDMLLGFSALYVLSLGMGIPLILFGITGGKLLPKAGHWMNIVKVAFGFMMLSVAMMFVERLVVNIWTELAWVAIGLSAFSYFYVVNQNSNLTFWKGVRTLVILLGFFASATYGYHQVYNPVMSVTNGGSALHKSQFVIAKDLSDFKQKLAIANSEGKSVMIDLYADWCVACKEFEKYTFGDSGVQKALGNTVTMQIDLTDNTDATQDFMENFAVLGLPTILFFDAKGEELNTARVTGFMRAEPFANHLNQILAQ